MKFLVNRTSCWSDSCKPCAEAKQTSYVYYDWRTVNDPKKLTYHNALNDWYSHGENHRVERGNIVRDLPHDNGWSVDFETMDDLLKFVNKYGRVVVSNWDDHNLPMIEIYDDYRE